jgi:hypothetical protein
VLHSVHLVSLERKITGALVAASAPETDYSSASYAFVVTNAGSMSGGPPAFGLPWIADLAAAINVIAGFVYFIVFTSFLLGVKITGAISGTSDPEIDYSSDSYALTVTYSVVRSGGKPDFGMPWIADFAASINVIAGFV